MKLELDITSSEETTFSVTSEGFDAASVEETKKMLRQGIQLAKEDNRPEARQMLLRVTEAEPNNETAWLWLASISEYPEELLVFLQNVLKINPENERAIEWSKQTKSLLSKTFVQRGINAYRDGQRDFAKQCFLQGIVHDAENEMAWLWLASSSESQEEKVSHLQKVLSINPNNETALSSLGAVKGQMAQIMLKKANALAIAGEREGAAQALESVMRTSPNVEEAWILKAYLANDFYEKIECYEKTLEIDPENEAALSGLNSLKAMAPKDAFRQQTPEEAPVVAETTAEALQSEPEMVEETETPAFEESMAAAQPETQQDFESETAEETFAADQESAVELSEFVAESEERQWVYENMGEAETEALETEHVDNPTQELDEKFAQTAEYAFQSFSEAPPETNEEVVKTEEQFEEQAVQEYSFAEETENEVVQEAESKVESQPEASFAAETDSEPDVESEPEAVNASKPVEEQVYASPFFQNTGASSVSVNEVYADYQQPTVDFTYSQYVEAENTAPVVNEEVHEIGQTYEQQIIEPAYSFVPTEEQTFTAPEAEDMVVPEPVMYAETHADEPVSAEAAPVELPKTYEEAVSNVLMQPCPFCETPTDVQAVLCTGCHAILSFSDLEMLLAHHDANQDVLLKAIERLDVEREIRQFQADDLTNLALAHLNAKNTRRALEFLREASAMNPNDIVLSSNVNLLAIRLNEIEVYDTKALENPVRTRTILVVDDSPTVRKLITGKLEKCGHTVIPAVDGMDALAKINEITPDLVLLDITMPRLDGYQVCKMIRHNDVTKDVPIVMISGKDGFFDKVRGRMAGSTGYITKPFGPDTLMKTIETYLA